MMEDIHILLMGIIYLLMLFIPNIIWSRHLPIGYSTLNEKKSLLCLERLGQVLVSFFAVIAFRPFRFNLLVCVSFLLMLMYEGYWIRYFYSQKTLSDFYSSFLSVPLAGASLPVLAFLIYGLSQHHWVLVISTIILGIGHIGIHRQHFIEINREYS